jgi:hypothetical protein
MEIGQTETKRIIGSAFVPIPSSIQLPIPSIAFVVPDLEAVAQLKLIRVETNEVAGM